MAQRLTVFAMQSRGLEFQHLCNKPGVQGMPVTPALRGWIQGG